MTDQPNLPLDQVEPVQPSGLELMAEAEARANAGLTRGHELVMPAEAQRGKTVEEIDYQAAINYVGMTAALATLKTPPRR